MSQKKLYSAIFGRHLGLAWVFVKCCRIRFFPAKKPRKTKFHGNPMINAQKPHFRHFGAAILNLRRFFGQLIPISFYPSRKTPGNLVSCKSDDKWAEPPFSAILLAAILDFSANCCRIRFSRAIKPPVTKFYPNLMMKEQKTLFPPFCGRHLETVKDGDFRFAPKFMVFFYLSNDVSQMGGCHLKILS